jgi:acetyl esterase/lipase
VLYLASISRSMIATTLPQIEAQMRNPIAGLSAREVEAELASLRRVLADFMAGKPADPAQASKLPPLQRLVARLVNPATAKLSRPLLGFDTAAEAAKLPGPFLVLAAGKDVQIDPDLDARRLDEALRAAGRDVTLHLAADADHVLKHEPRPLAEIRANPVAVQRGYNAEGRTLDASAVAAIVAWLAAHSR